MYVPTSSPKKIPYTFQIIVPFILPSVDTSLVPSSGPITLQLGDPCESPFNNTSILLSLEPSKDTSNEPRSVTTSSPSVIPSTIPSIVSRTLPSVDHSMVPSSYPSFLPPVDTSTLLINKPSIFPSLEPSKDPSK